MVDVRLAHANGECRDPRRGFLPTSKNSEGREPFLAEKPHSPSA
jgi:hypothetical protein